MLNRFGGEEADWTCPLLWAVSVFNLSAVGMIPKSPEPPPYTATSDQSPHVHVPAGLEWLLYVKLAVGIFRRFFPVTQLQLLPTAGKVPGQSLTFLQNSLTFVVLVS
jgi:hypothetical protein